MPHSTDTFERIWAALDCDKLAALLAELDPRPHGSYVALRCPSCEKRTAYIYPSQDGRAPRLHCNRANNCAFDQTLWDYVKARRQGDGAAAFRELAGRADVPVNGDSRRGAMDPARMRRFTLSKQPTPTAELSESRDDMQQRCDAAFPGSPAESWALKRGVPADQVQRFGFGYSNAKGKHWLTYPFCDRSGRIVAVEGRLLPEQDAEGQDRWCFGPKGTGAFMPRGAFDPDGLHLCEGVFDAVALHSVGANAIAVGGKGCGTWLQQAAAFRKVWLCSDADDAGDKAAATWGKLLAAKGAGAVRLRPPDEGKDWGDYLRESGPERVRSAFLAAGGQLPAGSTTGELTGCKLLDAKALGERVLLVLDEAARIPARYAGLVPYTRAEVPFLAGADADHLRFVHHVKKTWPGAFVVSSVARVRDEVAA